MKKHLIMLLALIVAITMAACGGGNQPVVNQGGDTQAPTQTVKPPDPPPPPPPPPPEELNVAVFYYSFADVYISTVRSSMDEQLRNLGVKFQNYDADNKQTMQSEQITTAITNGANMLIVNIVDTASPDPAQNAVNEARARDIPIVFFNREVDDSVVNSYDKCAFVGTDAPEAGHMQGKMIGEYLLANYDSVDINGDGNITYVMLKGQEGNAEAEARTQFGVEDANKVLTAAGKPELVFYDANSTQKYLVDQDGAWSPKWSNIYLSTIISEYNESNGNMLEIVIAMNDGMAEGAVSALQSAGYNLGNGSSKTIPVFGVSGVDSAKQLIDEGKMAGTVMQDAVGMASHICALVSNVNDGVAIMNGIAAKYVVDAGVDKIRVPYVLYQ